MASFKQFCALVLAAAVLLCSSTASASGSTTFELVGRSTHLRLTSGNSSVNVRIGRVFETTAEGTKVQGHALPSLASLQPAVSNGE
jgi:hypothetical protein